MVIVWLTRARMMPTGSDRHRVRMLSAGSDRHRARPNRGTTSHAIWLRIHTRHRRVYPVSLPPQHPLGWASICKVLYEALLQLESLPGKQRPDINTETSEYRRGRFPSFLRLRVQNTPQHTTPRHTIPHHITPHRTAPHHTCAHQRTYPHIL